MSVNRPINKMCFFPPTFAGRFSELPCLIRPTSTWLTPLADNIYIYILTNVEMCYNQLLYYNTPIHFHIHMFNLCFTHIHITHNTANWSRSFFSFSFLSCVWSRCDQQLQRMDGRRTEAELLVYELRDRRSFSLEFAQLPCSGVHSSGLRSRPFGEGPFPFTLC